jgi:prepilin signal peptidase PulO-like enzyme (type II secretory pathway)
MGVVSLVTLTVLIGGISAMGYLALSTLLKGRDGVSAAIPYGPSIALAAALVLLYGSDVAMRIL